MPTAPARYPSNRVNRKGVMALLVFAAGVAALHGQFAQTNLFTNLNLAIPDGNANGMQDVRNVVAGIVQITSVRVRLNVPGTYNGDLYGYVRHSSGTTNKISVLLNRVGRKTNQGNDRGYSDPGFDVTLDDLAANDIHTYGTLPPHTTLSGTWQPDARNVDPTVAITTSPRTAFLSEFAGLSASGDWILFLADMDGGGNSTNFLDSWGLEITGKARPSITWANPAAITYGTALGANQLNATAHGAGTNVSGTFAYNPPAGTVLGAGSNQTLSVTFVPADTDSYIQATTNVTLIVTAVPLAVAADNFSRPYGTTNPVFTATYSGFVNGENASVLSGTLLFQTAADTNSPVGTYAIEPGGLTATNYAITFSNGTLTVTKAVSVPALVSSANPALPGSLVTFTINLTALAPSHGTPSGAVQFKVDGTNYGAPVTLTDGHASLSTAALTAGEHAVSVDYAGDSNFLGATAVLTPQQVINTPPVAAPDVLPRVPNHLTKMPVSILLANDTDADGDAVMFDSVSATSAAGGTLGETNGWVFYTPPVGFTNDDSFNYVVQDGHGGFATGAVAVVILTDRGTAARLTLTNVGNGTFRIVLAGIPWGNYAIEFAERLLSANTNWGTLALGPADLWGNFVVDDVAPMGALARSYRAIYKGDGDSSLPFRLSLVSSTNPASPGSTVSFSASFTPFAQGSPVPSGTVQFKVDGVAQGSPVPLAGGSASLSTSTLARGEHSISAEYSGDTNYQSAICVLSRPQVINTPPVAGDDFIQRNPIHGIKVPVSDLLTNASDADIGDPLVWAISPTSVEGGTISLADGWVFYAPPAGFVGPDSFTYTVRDSLGATANATVWINPSVGSDKQSANLTVVDLGGGTFRIIFAGVPWRIYTVQYTGSLEQPNWQSIATNTADSYGLFVYDDTLPQGTPSRFYRSVPQFAGPNASPFRLAVWTNFIARTNGRANVMWSQRTYDPNNPPPVLAWNPNCLLYGLDGFTGVSQINEFEGSPGQVPVTLLTRRHGYTRGHGMVGTNDLNVVGTKFAGKRVWFCTANNTVEQMTVAAELIRYGVVPGGGIPSPDQPAYDYGLVIFANDVPESISPVFAMSPADMEVYYLDTPDLPYLWLGTEQLGHFAPGVANIFPMFDYDIWKPGDSGSPNLIPSPDNKLIMFSGRSTSGFSRQMQADIDALSVHEGVNPNDYQLRWYDLSPWAP